MNFKMEPIFHKLVYMDSSKKISQKDLVDLCYSEYLIFLKESDFSEKIIKIIGISFPGSVDSQKKYIISCPCFNWKKDYTFCSYFEEKFKKPICIENDVKASLINEYYRHPTHRASSIAFLVLDNGIGCSFMQNGIILKGINNGAGEIAHITLDHPHSKTYCCSEAESCYCPPEDYRYNLCTSYILYLAREAGLQCKTIKDLSNAYLEGNSLAIAFFKSISVQVSAILNLIICLYNPEKIILGGYTMHTAPFLLDLALSNTDLFYQDVAENIKIELTLEPENEPILGGAVVALNYHRDKLIESSFLI